MELENILKIADIENRQLSTETLAFLQNEVQHTYADQVLKEHIYNSGDILDGIDGGDYSVPAEVEAQLREIHELCGKNECGYFRVTHP